MALNPLIYVAGLRRGGTTALAAALTRLPESVVFPEPHFDRGGFRVEGALLQQLIAHGVDLRTAKRDWHDDPRGDSVDVFYHHVYRPLMAAGIRVGIKEIEHDNWRAYLKLPLEIRFVVLGRDIRDVYRSLKSRVARFPEKIERRWPDGLNPDTFADYAREQLKMQQEMVDQHQHFKLRYENFCTDMTVQQELQAFCGLKCELRLSTAVLLDPQVRPKVKPRSNEFNRHGNAITSASIGRWKTADAELRAECESVYAKTPEYQNWWGY